jgi:VacB/RNase II family 3'-5' exoribonuclease
MAPSRESERALLLRVAQQAMLDHGFEPEFPPAALTEASALSGDVTAGAGEARDLRALPWCSIDNDDSRDLDQLSVAGESVDGRTTIRVAIADVSATVGRGSALDRHARTNTTSVYTPPRIFPMLPERLSTDLTSLNPDVDRLAVVIEFAVGADGLCGASAVYRALVHNHAKLAYRAVGAWLEGDGLVPPAAAAVPGLMDNLKVQDAVAQRLKTQRHAYGALELETIELRPEMDDDSVTTLIAEKPNRARTLIEDFMIAANGTIARFLEGHRFPVLRRVVRSPERWQRIAAVAAELGERLPGEPDPIALNAFLLKRRDADPLRFPDLSLTIIKLLGRGEYLATVPGQGVVGHFGLAVSEYTHSTAPNRRYPDLITQRLVHAALADRPIPYAHEELGALAMACTLKEDGAQKVERLVRKAAAACVLSRRIGQEFKGIVTGASAKGTWVRIFDPPVEGRVERGQEGLDVGDRVRVRLVHTNPERGFIDFHRVGR